MVTRAKRLRLSPLRSMSTWPSAKPDGRVSASEKMGKVEYSHGAKGGGRAKDDEKKTLITGPYLVDAERLDGRVRASHIRERMRALGPTCRIDLGKQAEGKGAGFAAPEGV